MAAQPPAMSYAPFINIALTIGIIQLANRFELERPDFVPYLRAAYFTTQLLVLSVTYYIRMKITEKNDKTVLVYTEAKSFLEPKNVETITTTVKDHDLKKTGEAFQQTALAILMMSVMHFQFGYIRPLLLQAVMGLRAVATTQLFEIYVMGKPATGALARPWKKGMFDQTGPAATPKEAKNLEKKEQKKKLAKGE
ncbi:inorganic phosphate transporter Pho88 [Chytriomyces sp. MP71]|nr:inorganic phosphate transporter Pho88 [Chytriomyces sp. MP71]